MSQRKRVIRQYNGTKKKDEMTSSGRHNTTQK